jgi:hypothetical protein
MPMRALSFVCSLLLLLPGPELGVGGHGVRLFDLLGFGLLLIVVAANWARRRKDEQLRPA